MRLHPHEFFRRLLPKGVHRIYGKDFLANSARAESFATARVLLDVAHLPPTRKKQADERWMRVCRRSDAPAAALA
jgi:hypothetical protein